MFACFLRGGFRFYCAVVGEVLALGTLDDVARLEIGVAVFWGGSVVKSSLNRAVHE